MKRNRPTSPEINVLAADMPGKLHRKRSDGSFNDLQQLPEKLTGLKIQNKKDIWMYHDVSVPPKYLYFDGDNENSPVEWFFPTVSPSGNKADVSDSGIVSPRVIVFMSVFFFGNRRYLVESSCSITNLGPHHLDRNLAVSKNRVYPQFFQFHRMESPRAVMTLNSSLYFLKPPDNRGVYPRIASNSHVNSMGKIDVLIHWNWGVSRT